jgi:23S rRNA pseudouridine1911/1915/1917 synthase
MSEPVTITISTELVGKTVLAVLRVAAPGESWSKLRNKLVRSQVTVNGVACIDEARRVEDGDRIELHDRQMKAAEPVDVNLLYVDPHIVVVEKPAGIMTHRRPEERFWSDEKKARQPTLEECVAKLLARRSHDQGGRDRKRPVWVPQLRIVHRLDRDTSGVLVMARNDEAELKLIDQFRRHAAHRVYWAIVHGHPVEETIQSNIVRDRGDGRRGSVNNPKMGQRAVTHVRPLEDLGDYSLVECRLETGRTNQIRIHLSERGHLVCGDAKYSQPYAAKPIEDRSGAPRLSLHAAELGFKHPVTGEDVCFRIPFPRDLSDFYNRLVAALPAPSKKR